MTEIDYEELIRSPLDDLGAEGGRSGWFPVAAGWAVGFGVSLLLVSGLGDNAVDVETMAVDGQSPSDPAVESVAPDYPDGYTELLPGVGATVSEIVVTDEVVAVTFLVAVGRGEDPLARTWPLGGTWLLESRSGVMAQSTRVVVGRLSPAVFTVEFPAAAFGGEEAFATVSTVELWNQVAVSGSVEQPFVEAPWVGEPVSVPIGSTSTLILSEVELGRTLGYAEWQLEGQAPGGIVEVSARLLDVGAVEVAAYESRFPSRVVPAFSGSSGLGSDLPFRANLDAVVTVAIDYEVSTVDVVAVDVSFDVSSVSSG